MKKVLTVLLVLISSYSFGQFTINGDTLVIKEAKFVKGSKIKIGYGSGANKYFAYITSSPFSLAGKNNMDKSYANLQMTIKEIRVLKNKRVGEKVFLILKGVMFADFWCDIEAAIDQGEVKVQ